MQTVPKLRHIIMQLAARHRLNLRRPGAYLRLQMLAHGHLVVENIGAERISVTNYIQVGHEFQVDPEVVLYMVHRPAGAPEPEWVPLEITQLFGGWRLYAELDLQGGLVVHDLVGQAELADLCERVLATSLIYDNWLEHAEQVNFARPVWTPEEIYARDIRSDDVPF